MWQCQCCCKGCLEAQIHSLKIANTYFKNKDKRKWTCVFPDSKTRNKIHHLIISNLRIVENITIPSFELHSDHRIARPDIKILRIAKYRNFASRRERGRWIIIPKQDTKCKWNSKKQIGNSRKSARRLQYDKGRVVATGICSEKGGGGNWRIN